MFSEGAAGKWSLLVSDGVLQRLWNGVLQYSVTIVFQDNRSAGNELLLYPGKITKQDYDAHRKCSPPVPITRRITQTGNGQAFKPCGKPSYSTGNAVLLQCQSPAG